MKTETKTEPWIADLVAAAQAAPSGDNTQPTRFVVDHETRSIHLVIDPTRDPSPMNRGQRMARMSAGASIENLVRSAGSLGLRVALEPGPPGMLATVRLSGEAQEPAKVDEALSRRVTNRKFYDGRAVEPEVLDRLRASSPDLDGVTTHWIVDRDRIKALARLIGEADSMMFGEPSMRRAFLSKVRFDQPSRAVVAEGLSLGSLEASGPEQLALRSLGSIPDRVLSLVKFSEVIGQKTRKLVASSSGLCLVVAPDGRDETDLTVGRAFQKAWLAMAAEGLATQPLMSWVILENLQDHGDPGLIATVGPGKLKSLLDRFRAMMPEREGRRPAWLMRFGRAKPPTSRTGRLPSQDVILGANDPTGPGHPSGA